MGDVSANLQLGLAAMLGHGTRQDFRSAMWHFQRILKAKVSVEISPRDREDALHWSALLNLLGLAGRRNVNAARRKLLQADADRDHESSSDLLNVLGRTPGKRQLRDGSRAR